MGRKELNQTNKTDNFQDLDDIASEIKEMATLYGLQLLAPEKVPKDIQGTTGISLVRYTRYFALPINELSKLTLNAPIATKVACFSRLLKCLRSLHGKECGPRSDCS